MATPQSPPQSQSQAAVHPPNTPARILIQNVAAVGTWGRSLTLVPRESGGGYYDIHFEGHTQDCLYQLDPPICTCLLMIFVS
jgi:hypothetical protein